MANNYQTDVEGVRGLTNEKIKFLRPTTINWSEFNLTIRPVAGQPIRIRESMEFLFTKNPDVDVCAIWNNRYIQEKFVGHYQITRLGGTGGTTDSITERGIIIGNDEGDEFFTKWTFQKEYNLSLFLNKTDINAGYLSAITNCNAYLAPSPVPNLKINAGNVDKYVRIAYGIATGDLANAATLIDSLTEPTIAGYTFPEEVLFRGVNNIPGIDLENIEFNSRLGNILLWIHPQWSIIESATYIAEVIDYKVLAQTLDQFPDGTQCNFNGGLDFP